MCVLGGESADKACPLGNPQIVNKCDVCPMYCVLCICCAFLEVTNARILLLFSESGHEDNEEEGEEENVAMNTGRVCVCV